MKAVKFKYVIDLNQAEFHMSGLKQILEKQDNENKQLQSKIGNLQKENENLSRVNTSLFEKLNKLEKESSEKIARFVFAFYFKMLIFSL